VFVGTKAGVNDLYKSLRKAGWYSVRSIHGDKHQKEREEILQEFKASSNLILIATDVASRGLDVKDITVVINYDMPP
jgi:superfamily II DNA/RNA helicase